MKKFTPTQLKSISLVVFSALCFLVSNAQRRGERQGQFNHGDRSPSGQMHQPSRFPQQQQQQPGINANRGGMRPPVRENHADHPSDLRPGQRLSRVDRDFRNDRANTARGGYPYNNNRYGHDRYPRYSPRNPSWRYGYLPARRSIVSSFPFAYQTINFGGFGYRYYNGTYYRPYNDAFIVCAPPFGLFINTLPFGYRRIYVNDYPYYYYNGTYYDQYQDNYRVVAPPVGAVVESLPQGYEALTIDGETYYQVDGVQYKPAVQDNGEIWYEVIKVN